jgi:hypothetical protein
MKHQNECYILGSGRSILDLSATEKQYVHNHPNTLALNKYFLFWEKTGILPKALFLADFKFPGMKVYVETIRKAKRQGAAIPFYANFRYSEFFDSPLDKTRWKLRMRWRLFRHFRYLPPLTIAYEPLIFFRVKAENEQIVWARDLSETLFHRRGSLSTAINLATIVHPGCRIKLLGVDLNDPKWFFDEELRMRPDLIDHSYHRSRAAGRHATALKSDEYEGTIQDTIRELMPCIHNSGSDLVCCNPESLLVTHDVCPYAPVIE